MKIIISLILMLGLSGCQPTMTNDEIIAEKDKCLKGGMSYTIHLNGLNMKVNRVQCTYPSGKDIK